MNLPYRTDEWLMAEVAKGCHEHLEPLVRRYASPLLTFIHRMAGNHSRSEELFQDVFLAIWEKRHSYKTGRPFKPWIYAIALNKCREVFRHRALPMAHLTEEQLVYTSTSAAPGPVDVLAATETAAMVQAALAELPAKQRAVVVMRVWNGLSYSEIAHAVGRREGTVRALMHRALASIRHKLEPYLH